MDSGFVSVTGPNRQQKQRRGAEDQQSAAGGEGDRTRERSPDDEEEPTGRPAGVNDAETDATLPDVRAAAGEEADGKDRRRHDGEFDLDPRDGHRVDEGVREKQRDADAETADDTSGARSTVPRVGSSPSKSSGLNR